jgi:hypothetical protein
MSLIPPRHEGTKAQIFFHGVFVPLCLGGKFFEPITTIPESAYASHR